MPQDTHLADPKQQPCQWLGPTLGTVVWWVFFVFRGGCFLFVWLVVLCLAEAISQVMFK